MKKRLEKKINIALSLLIITVLLPLLTTIVIQRMRLSDLIAGMEEQSAVENLGQYEWSTAENLQGQYEQAEQEEQENREQIEQEKQEKKEQAEQKVLGIVAKEISVNSSKEAILAQCVIARTNLYAAWETQTGEPEAFSINEMQDLWGEEFDTAYQKLESCVEETRGQVLVWNGDYIYAAYHAISAGETRVLSELYSDAKMPYLTRVSCPADTMAEGYLSVWYLQAEELKRAQIVSRDEAGYVLEVQMDGETYTGEEFRSKYGLPSACFTIRELNGKIRIVTKGLGHGMGLSQHMAVHMAEEGRNYKEILDYFYPGTKLVDADTVK